MKAMLISRPNALQPVTRRDFVQALLAALATGLRPLAIRFSPLAAELARLTCWRASEFERHLRPA